MLPRNTLHLLVNDIHKEQSPVQDKLHDQASLNFQIDACNIFSGEKETNLVLKNSFYYISKCHYKGNITNIIPETQKQNKLIVKLSTTTRLTQIPKEMKI